MAVEYSLRDDDPYLNLEVLDTLNGLEDGLLDRWPGSPYRYYPLVPVTLSQRDGRRMISRRADDPICATPRSSHMASSFDRTTPRFLGVGMRIGGARAAGNRRSSYGRGVETSRLRQRLLMRTSTGTLRYSTLLVPYSYCNFAGGYLDLPTITALIMVLGRLTRALVTS